MRRVVRRWIDMNEDITLDVPKNAQLVDGGNVSFRIGDVTFTCPCCGIGTKIDPPRSDCDHCGVAIALMVGHGPCGDPDG